MATGIDLKMPEKGKRKKKVDESALTNIKKEQDTVHRRLEKKLFKRYASHFHVYKVSTNRRVIFSDITDQR